MNISYHHISIHYIKVNNNIILCIHTHDISSSTLTVVLNMLEMDLTFKGFKF